MYQYTKRQLLILETIFHIATTIVCLVGMFYLEGIPKAVSRYGVLPHTAFIFKAWVFSLALGAVRNSRFKYAAFPLVGVGLFDSGDLYPMVNLAHDICGLMFFCAVAYSLYKVDRTRLFISAFLLGIPIVFCSLYWLEIYCISILICYFLTWLYKLL